MGVPCDALRSADPDVVSTQVIRPFLVSKVQSRSLQKPILVIVITGAHDTP